MTTRPILQTVLVVFFIVKTCVPKSQKFALLMPNPPSSKEETCYCTSVKILSNKTYYLTGFEPIGATNMIHHMILFGCSKTGRYSLIWDCCEKRDPCDEGMSIMYSWSMRSRGLQLPENMGFPVGKGTSVHYLVIQIHWMKFGTNQSDSSGLNVIYTGEKREKLAGILLLGANGFIPPYSITHMEVICRIAEKKIIYPFAFRVHTHALGKTVAGYRVRRDHLEVDHWTLLGKEDPRVDQTFAPVFNKGAIQYQDKIAARCTMNGTQNKKIVSVGYKQDDEMCNFYLLYYVKEEENILQMKYCISEGPPCFYWSNKENHLNNIPDGKV